MDRNREKRAAKMERRATQRQAQGQLESTAQKPRTLLYGAAGVVFAVLLLGGTILARGCEAQTSTVSTPQPPSTLAVVDKTETYRQILDQEVTRLGIAKNPQEIDLWTQNGYFPSRRIPVTPETQIQAARILQSTLTLMTRSENPYFREATDYLKPLVTNGDVQLSLPTTISTGTSLRAVMGTETIITNGKLVSDIFIPADYLLNSANSVELALSLTHETQHVKNARNFLSSLPTELSIAQKLEKERERFKTSRLAEEASGHGSEALAIIQQYGFGERRMDKTDIEDAATFIRFGSNVQSPDYRNYVAVTLLHLPPGSN